MILLHAFYFREFHDFTNRENKISENEVQIKDRKGKYTNTWKKMCNSIELVIGENKMHAKILCSAVYLK